METTTIFVPPFADIYQGTRVDLQTMLRELKNSPSFRRFIRNKLRKAFGPIDDPETGLAQTSLQSYYMPGADELDFFGPDGPSTQTCTEHGRLLSVVLDFQ